MSVLLPDRVVFHHAFVAYGEDGLPAPGATAEPGPVEVLWDRLDALRASRGNPSYAAMARQSGVPRSTLHHWFTRRVVPDWRSLLRLLAAFRQDPRRWKAAHEAARRAASMAARTAGRTRTAAGGAPGGAAGRAAGGAAGGEGSGGWAGVPPAQLPADAYGFTGRDAELARLDAILAAADGEPTVPCVCVLTGPAGVGKTALAVRWARRLIPRFPDGQLSLNLRGFDPAGPAVPPEQAVRSLLDALQVPPHRVPAGPDAQAALYRSLQSGRRMLVLLDNARDAEQVRLLLPAAPGCLAVVTSRHRLTGLAASDGAHLISLDVLPDAAARELLVRRLGAGRLAAEPAATGQVLRACAGLPLALTIVAARAAGDPALPLHDLAAELAVAEGRLDALAGDDPATNVRTAFAASYQALDPQPALLFRLLALHPGPDISAAAAASLVGRPPGAARRLLAELTRTHLAALRLPGRYAVHDLLREYAAELVHTVDGAAEQDAATGRMLDHYLATAHTAAMRLNPYRPPITPTPPRPGVHAERPGRHDDAMGWFTAELPVLLAAVRVAHGAGLDGHAWQLAWALSEYLDRRGRWPDWVATQLTALAAATRLGDGPALARIHRTLGIAYTTLGRPADAEAHLRQALDRYAGLDDRVGQAAVHHSLARARARRGDHAQALEHARRAADGYQAAGHRGGHADALNAVGWYHAQLGRYDEALRHCGQALLLHRETGHLLGEAGTLDSLGFAHDRLGQHADAVACYQRAVELYRAAGEQYEQAATLTRLGDAHDASGDVPGARSAWREAERILGDLDHPDADRLRTRLVAAT